MPAGELLHVSKRLGRHLVVDDVTLSVAHGEIVGLVGPNGAGKTTLLRIFAGLLRPSRGEVRAVTAAGVRYFGGEQTLPPQVSARRWYRLFSQAGADAITARPFGDLSRGTRPHIGVDAAIAAPGASLVLLDEPWEGLDPDASRWLSNELTRMRAAGTAILVSSHRIHDLAAVCDRCEFILEGRVAVPTVDCGGGLSGEQKTALLFQTFDRIRGGR